MIPSDSSLETKFTFQSGSQPVPEESPFHILLLGNWSGDADSNLSSSKPIVIDRDNFDDIMAKLNICLDLDIYCDASNIVSLSFKEIDDFHPDNIFHHVPMFSELRDLRRRLLNDSTFNEAAMIVRSLLDEDQLSETDKSETLVSQTNNPNVDSENLLDNILNQSSKQQPTISSHSKELSELLKRVVKPYIVQTDENEQAKLLEAVDDLTSDLMRSILHHPEFQALEAAWRGVYLLVRTIETGIDFKIYLFDISKSELVSTLKSPNQLTDSTIYKCLINPALGISGEDSFAVVCGIYTFELNIDDVAALIRLSKISCIADAPFISYILPEMLGISSFSTQFNASDLNVSVDSPESKLWNTLRSLSESEYLGFAIPQFLSRLPYGNDTEPTETFSFEEFSDPSQRNEYLWSNPSFLCALVIAQTYRKFGWEMNGNFQLTLSDLPTHIYHQGDEVLTQHSVEILMSETVCKKFINEGLMPLIAYQNSDHIEFGIIQSVSNSNQRLSGKWN